MSKTVAQLKESIIKLNRDLEWCNKELSIMTYQANIGVSRSSITRSSDEELAIINGFDLDSYKRLRGKQAMKQNELKNIEHELFNGTCYTVKSRRSDAIDDIRVASDRTHNMDDFSSDYCFIVSSDCGIVAIVATIHNDMHEALDDATDAGLMKRFEVSDEDIAAMEDEDCDPSECYAVLGNECTYHDIQNYFYCEMVPRASILPLPIREN